MSKELAGVWPSVLEFGSLKDAYSPAIQEQLFTNHLIILKGIGGVSVQEFADFASRLGEPEQPLADANIHELDGRVEILRRNASDDHYQHSLYEATDSSVRKPSSFYWHADRSFLPQPSFLTVTRVVKAAETGGTTDFINTEIAYKSLAEEDAMTLRGLVGVHRYAHYHEKLAGNEIYAPDEIIQKRALYPPAEHSLVTAHPVTGRPVVYTSPLTLERIVDSDKNVLVAENILTSILDETKHSYYSHTWGDGDVVIWDNFGVLHRGSASRGERELQRMTVALPS